MKNRLSIKKEQCSVYYWFVFATVPSLLSAGDLVQIPVLNPNQTGTATNTSVCVCIFTSLLGKSASPTGQAFLSELQSFDIIFH